MKHDISSLERRVSKIEIQIVAINAKQDGTIEALERLKYHVVHNALCILPKTKAKWLMC